MINWKTTVSGIVTAGAALIGFLALPPYSVHFPSWLLGTASFVTVGGFLSLGISAKDNNVTGGTKQQ
jgi:hypothetical protein